jgi:ParB-like chromosome segregation protein Spo0J
MTHPLRNRIKDHRRVRFGDLVPHELNPRLHPDHQRAALQQLYQEIGFARSLLAFELPDGRLKLIDGHLRASLTPDDILDVEVLDVTEEEARVLLLSIDPLAELVNYDAQLLDRLRKVAEQDSQAVQMIWNTCRNEEKTAGKPVEEKAIPRDRFFILIECADEEEQVNLLERFSREGFKCQAKIG